MKDIARWFYTVRQTVLPVNSATMEAMVFRIYIILFAVLGQISAANLLREKPKLLVITVPERAQNEARMISYLIEFLGHE